MHLSSNRFQSRNAKNISTRNLNLKIITIIFRIYVIILLFIQRLSRVRRRAGGAVDRALKQLHRRRQLQRRSSVDELQLQRVLRERSVVVAARPADREHGVQVDDPVQRVGEHAACRRPGYVRDRHNVTCAETE